MAFLRDITDVNVAVQRFYDTLIQAFDMYVPKGASHSTNTKFPRWYTRRIIADLKLKQKYHRRLVHDTSGYYMDLYKSLRKKVKHNIQVAFAHYINSGRLPF